MLYLSLAALLGLAIHREAAWAWLAIGAGASAHPDHDVSKIRLRTNARPVNDLFAHLSLHCSAPAPRDMHAQHHAPSAHARPMTIFSRGAPRASMHLHERA